MMKRSSYLYENAIKRCRERKENIMCEKLKELRGMSAEDILRKAGQEGAAPVDMDKVFSVLKLYKQGRDFSDIEEIEGQGKISGLVILIGNDVEIFFNSNDDLQQKRFTAAHEIGHCCLHGESLKNDYIEFLHNDGFENEHEEQASIFAARLLVPQKSLVMVYNRLIKPAVSILSEIFQVPESLMELRLKEEKLKVIN